MREKRHSTVNQHVATVHEKKKQFKCDICTVNFRQKGSLNIHIATIHEGKKKFQCAICNANFGQNGILNNHEGKKRNKTE